MFFIMEIRVFRCHNYHFRPFFVDFSLFFRYFLNKKILLSVKQRELTFHQEIESWQAYKLKQKQ